MGFFDRFRARKGCWPWPNIDSPVVQSELLRTAYHEAGHAVVARCLGVDVEILSIRPEQGGGWPGENVKTSSGRVTLCHSPGVLRALVDALVDGMVESPYREAVDRLGQLRPCPEQESQVSAALQVFIAGEVVEQIKFGRRFGGNRSDLRFFHVLAQGFYGNLRHPIAGSTIATLRREHWDNCHRTLNRPEIWAWVEAVAQASLRHTVLTGDEIDGLRPLKRLSLPRARPLHEMKRPRDHRGHRRH